jgi:NADPH:quinone reductase-like Zn-dependent oxidoreductase
MRAVFMTRKGGPKVLEVRECPDPAPGPGQVRVRVRAAGVNFADVMARLGLYSGAPQPPCILGLEAAGVVDAVGSGVESPAVGTRVLVLSSFAAQAELLVVPARQAIPLPEGMSFEDGAALPVNYLTAYHALFRVGALRPGEKVLVHMAAGGVGIAALQLCRTVPGVVTFGTASAKKHEVIRAHGCDHPIDYRTLDYAAEVRRLGGGGVDLVLDPLGGGDWRKGYDLLRPAGRLIAYGFANLASGERRNLLHLARQLLSVPRFSPLRLMNDNRSVAGIYLGSLWNEQEMLMAEVEALFELHRRGAIRPLVDAILPFAEAPAAHRRLQERRNVGKVLLAP